MGSSVREIHGKYTCKVHLGVTESAIVSVESKLAGYEGTADLQ
jgi:hypothetical protein